MKPTRFDFRTATEADVSAFYGTVPYSMRACVALMDGVPSALSGVAYHNGCLYAFMELRDEMRQHKVSVGRFMKYSRSRLAGMFSVPGIAMAQPGEAMAPRVLQWLGFQHVASCRDGEVYEWRN